MNQERGASVKRREFLKGAAGVAGTFGMAGVFQSLMSKRARAAAMMGAGFGPLAPVADDATGLPLILLPEGYSYVTYGWTGDVMSDGNLTPPVHDGMAVVDKTGNRVVLVRNHELRGAGPAFPSKPKVVYDLLGQGGTTNLAFNVKSGEWLNSWTSLAGTSTNCAGGPTPWGSWITCEETMDGPAQGYVETHGWCFEVPGAGPADPTPIKGMGRFSHEAIAVDPTTGIVYLTEDDRYTSGFYRYLPVKPLKKFGLKAGGVLQMLKVVGVDNAVLIDVVAGDTFDVEWVTIDDPEMGPGPIGMSLGDISGSTSSASGPFIQGWNGKAARFRRLEGCWYGDGLIYFDDTEAGPLAADTDTREGAIWAYDPVSETLVCIYASPAEMILDNPDNLTIAPDGSVFLCEDGSLDGLRIHRLTTDGHIEVFAQNDIVLAGEKNGIVGDFRGAEWAGATFDPTGQWLFANIQSPGITFAITGPWPWMQD